MNVVGKESKSALLQWNPHPHPHPHLKLQSLIQQHIVISQLLWYHCLWIIWTTKEAIQARLSRQIDFIKIHAQSQRATNQLFQFQFQFQTFASQARLGWPGSEAKASKVLSCPTPCLSTVFHRVKRQRRLGLGPRPVSLRKIYKVCDQCVDLIKIRLGDFVCRLDPILRLPWAFPTLVVHLPCFWSAVKWCHDDGWSDRIGEKERTCERERTYQTLNKTRCHQSQKQRFPDWILFQLFFNASKTKPPLQTYIFYFSLYMWTYWIFQSATPSKHHLIGKGST